MLFLPQTGHSVYPLERQLFCRKRKKGTITLCEKNTEMFNVKSDDTRIYH